ncbi:MAG: TolC family protein [Elusimicrobiota bacterium]
MVSVKNNKFLIAVISILGVTGNIYARGLTLEDFLNKAVVNNYDIRISRQEVEEAEGEKKEIWGNFFPSISASYNQLYMDKIQQVDFEMPLVTPTGDIVYEEVDIDMGQKDIYEGKISVQQPVFTFGTISGSHKIAKRAKEIQQKKFFQKKKEIQPRVRKAFYGVLMAKDMVEISKKQKELMEENLKITKKLYDAGKASHLDISRMEVQVSRAESKLVEARSGLKKSRAALFNLSGMKNSQQKIMGELKSKEFDYDLQQLENLALKNRSELEIAREGIKINKLQKKLAYRQNLPKIYAYGNYTWERPYQNSDEWGDYWTVGGRVEFPFLDGLSLLGRNKKNRAALERSEISVDKLKAAIRLQVKNNYYSLREAQKNIKVQRQNLKQLQENLTVSQKRYSRGLLDSMELNQAVLNYSRGRIELTSSIFNYLSSMEDLKIAVGSEFNTGKAQ